MTFHSLPNARSVLLGIALSQMTVSLALTALVTLKAIGAAMYVDDTCEELTQRGVIDEVKLKEVRAGYFAYRSLAGDFNGCYGAAVDLALCSGALSLAASIGLLVVWSRLKPEHSPTPPAR